MKYKPASSFPELETENQEPRRFYKAVVFEVTFFTNIFRTPTLGFLLGDVSLILYNCGIMFEISAMKVCGNRMRKLGLQNLRSRSLNLSPQLFTEFHVYG